MKFKKGLTVGGKKYGWKGNDLYRLPYTTEKGHFYGLKKLKKIKLRDQYGYAVDLKPKSISQLKSMTETINVNVPYCEG